MTNGVRIRDRLDNGEGYETPERNRRYRAACRAHRSYGRPTRARYCCTRCGHKLSMQIPQTRRRPLHESCGGVLAPEDFE